MQHDNPKLREQQRSVVVVERPQRPHSSFPWRHALETDDPGDLDILRAKFPGDEFNCTSQVHVGSQIVAADNDKPCKIDILIGWVRQQFVLSVLMHG